MTLPNELAMESPRVWTWERREKLLLMVTLFYGFLLSLLANEWDEVRLWLLRVVSSDRKAEPRGRSSALPLALGTESALASLPFVTRNPQIKFAMTHVFLLLEFEGGSATPKVLLSGLVASP